MSRKTTKKPTKETGADVPPPELTPLELATLTAHLQQAGLIERGDTRQCLAASLAFLDDSREVLNVQRAHLQMQEEWKRFKARFEKLTEGIGDDGNVPVEILLKCARVERIKLTPDELQSIGIQKEWGVLTGAARIDAIYMFLTREPVHHEGEFPLMKSGRMTVSRGSRSAGSIEERKRALREGVPAFWAGSVVELLQGAHEKRKRDNASKAGSVPKKKRKPRAPKGGDGKFKPKEPPPQDVAGKFKKKPRE